MPPCGLKCKNPPTPPPVRAVRSGDRRVRLSKLRAPVVAGDAGGGQWSEECRERRWQTPRK